MEWSSKSNKIFDSTIINWSNLFFFFFFFSHNHEKKKNGFVQGSISEIISKGIVSIFLPHGVGHFIGIDVHDTYVSPSVRNSFLS